MINDIEIRGDQRFFNTVLNGSLILVLVGILTSWLENMPFYVLAVHFVALIILFGLKRSVKLRPHWYGFFVHFYLIFCIVVVAIVYFLNAGADGAIVYIYLALIQAGFLITGRTKAYWFAFAVPIVVCAMLLLEYYFPSLVVPYESRDIRYADIVISIFILVGMTTYFSIYSNKWIRKERQENQVKTQEIERAHDQTLAALKTREDFLSVMSHEIRTPLNAVLGFSQLLDQTALSDEQKELNKHILQGGEQLLDLMNQVLDYSRLQKSLNTVRLEEVEIVSTISNACTLHMPKVTEKKLSCELVFDLELPAKLEIDKPRFLQILNNLMSNAIKFTDKGVIRVSLRQEENAYLVFTVEDTGIGIKEDYLQKIFEPFEQVDSSLSRSFDGAGLGLAVCWKNAEIMAGQLLVKSEISKGSAFTLKLPLLSASESIRTVCTHPFGFDSYYLNSSSPVLNRFSLWLDEFSCERILDQKNIRENTLVLSLNTPSHLPKELTFYSAPEDGHLALSHIHLGLFLSQIKELAHKSDADDTKASKQQSNINVLVVDDNQLNQLVAKKMLENLEVKSTIASTGEEAIALCMQEEFHLVLMDIYMPGMNGFETSDKLRELGYKGKIVALSAQEDIGLLINKADSSFTAYIPKPLTLESLSELVA